MEPVLAIVVGVLYAAGVYMLLRRSIVRLIIGLALLSNAANLLIFTSSGLTRGNPPVMSVDEKVLSPAAADPLPQALILTAIVISFGVLAFAVVLLKRAYETAGADDLSQLRSTDT